MRNFEKAAKVAMQFEKDYSDIYSLVSIGDPELMGDDELMDISKYGSIWYRCEFYNKITLEIDIIYLPEDGIEHFRVPNEVYFKGKWPQIVINGSNEWWESNPNKAFNASGCITEVLDDIASKLMRFADDFDISEIDESDVEYVRDAIEYFDKKYAEYNTYGGNDGK